MKGGKRSGAGRKPIGDTRRISVTLPSHLWDLIDATEMKKSEFFRMLVEEKASQSDIYDYLEK